MSNYMILNIENNIREIYELFGNIVTIEDIETRNVIVVGLIVNCKILLEIIDSSKINHDLNGYESKSLKVVKERLVDLIDRCKIIVESKNYKNIIKLMTKMVISKPNEKCILKPNLDLYFIDRFVESNTNYNNILHFDDSDRNILLFVRKTYLNLTLCMIEQKLSDKELNSPNCFVQKRNLNHQKELVNKSIGFIDLILKKSTLKNVSSQIYKMIK